MSDALTIEDLELLDRIAAESITPIDPPAFVRAKLMEAVRTARPLDETVPGEHESLTIRADEGRWRACGEGARMKKLSRNAERNTVTFLLELAPHAVLEAHDHRGPEDSYVVRGSCRIGAVALYEGDFHHVDAGAHHGDVVASEQGCLLLLTVDLADAA